MTSRSIAKTSHFGGTVRVPGDKSIAHRALILGAAASGEQTVAGLPDAADVRSTAACLHALGARVDWGGDGRATVAWGEPVADAQLDAGNSGTTARLIAGFAAGRGVACTVDGDASLRRRPMGRVCDPLAQMGARVRTSDGGGLPLAIASSPLRGIRYQLPVASAQVKSALLIAGLFAQGDTTVLEPVPTRDHTERMLSAMGVELTREGNAITVRGGQTATGTHIEVPGDFSSAAYFLAAGACIAGAEATVSAIGINPARTGFLDVLRRMGAEVNAGAERHAGGEPVADLTVRSAQLRGVTVDDPAQIAAMIDEFPLLAVVAVCAEGETVVRRAAELRQKECDRIDAIVRNLRTLGADITEFDDGFSVRGGTRLRGAGVSSFGDHRIAMAMAVAGLVANGTTEIDDAGAVDISYPGFFDDLQQLTTGS